MHSLSRRDFLQAGLLLTTGGALWAQPQTPSEPVLDIHQHTNYLGRSNQALLEHQRALGVTHTLLLPAGRLYGLDAKAGGNDSVLELRREHPREFAHFANEVSDLPEAVAEIRRYLQRGAIGIGEQKFKVACDSAAMEAIAALAAEFGVPVLMHFQHNAYNLGIERFHRMLEKFPKVNFIGHAQTWWGNIDREHRQEEMYPVRRVERGGLTERLLSDYPNMYGDLSAGSGLNALLRDEEHARWFLEKHQRKLLFGSDCPDLLGRGPGCTGAQILGAVRRLAPNAAAVRRILWENGAALFRLKA